MLLLDRPAARDGSSHIPGCLPAKDLCEFAQRFAMVVQELIEACQFLTGGVTVLHRPIILNGLGLSTRARTKTEKSCQSC